MAKLCKIADAHGKMIVLQTAPKGHRYLGSGEYKRTSSAGRLKRFYRRFGFVHNYGKRSYRPDLRGNMHRPAKEFTATTIEGIVST